MTAEHEHWMRIAMREAELARGKTGDNPWVGCAIVSARGELLGIGRTQGPGEDHAEIAAARDAQERGHAVTGAWLYSTLEPCSFHGRTPACAHSIASRGVALVVTGMRDPNPRVNGSGAQILRDAGIEVIEGIYEVEVRRQLGSWILDHHAHEALICARSIKPEVRRERLAAIYGVTSSRIDAWLAKHAQEL